LPAVNARRAALAVAAGRVAFGSVFLLAPEPLAAAWVGPRARTPAGRVIARALGARDLLLGVGTLRALQRGHGAAEWMWYCAAADAVDGAATALDIRHLPLTGRAVAPLALLTAAAGAAIATCLDDDHGTTAA
jgi:hypothetical protein